LLALPAGADLGFEFGAGGEANREDEGTLGAGEAFREERTLKGGSRVETNNSIPKLTNNVTRPRTPNTGIRLEPMFGLLQALAYRCIEGRAAGQAKMASQARLRDLAKINRETGGRSLPNLGEPGIKILAFHHDKTTGLNWHPSTK